MSDVNEKLADIFDVTPIEKSNTAMVIHETRDATPATVDKLEGDLDEDYNMVRNNLEEIIDNGKEAMANLLEVATDGQHPRAYEVLAGLMKTLVDANKELIELQKKMREINGTTSKGNKGGVQVDKAVFVGSTQELMKMLKKKEQEND